jgi:TRAP-type C4-dicarboxylate transport system permease large subunit
VADISVLKLFLAGIVPGLLLGVACALVVYWRGRRGDMPGITNAPRLPRLSHRRDAG